MMKTYLAAIVSLAIMLAGCSSDNTDTVAVGDAALTPEEATQIAREAYIYGFPLILNYKTMYDYAIDKDAPEYKGDFNQISSTARVYTPEDRAIITPNSDTPYSFTWVDLRAEPVVYTIPEIEQQRFYQVQFIDLYTHNFAYIGSVATGNVPGNYMLTGPDWTGDIPSGITAAISSETQFILSIHRTQLFAPDDIDRVIEIQEGYKVEPLSAFLGTITPPAAAVVEFPKWKEGAELGAGSLEYLDFMLTLVRTPKEEQALMARLSRIGLGDGTAFELQNFTPEIQQALEVGVQQGMEAIQAFKEVAALDPLASAKIFGTRAFLNESAKENYDLDDLFMLRAVAAQAGIYGNSGDEAIYPTYFVDGDCVPLDASTSSYTMTFAKGDLPPVEAFWSLTMYDGKTQLLIDNPLDRYLLNSPMMDQFVLNDDGSLTLYLQKESPGEQLESNWLPAPDGPFYATLRLYGPKAEVLEGEWVSPPLVKTGD